MPLARSPPWPVATEHGRRTRMLPLAEETGDAQMQDVPRADEQMVKAGVRPSLEFVKAMGRRRPSGSAALARRDGLLAAGATGQGVGAAHRLRAPTT